MLLKFYAPENKHQHQRPPSFCQRISRFRVFTTLGFGLLLLSLAACSSGTVVQQTTPTPSQATPISTPANTVLFQSDWSKGLSAWKTTSGWKVKNGYIESDLSEKLSLTLPYQPTVANYAVEYRLQIVNVPKDGGQFQLTADKQADKDGYTADVLNLLGPGQHRFAIHPLAEVLVEPEESMENNAQILDYEPTSEWRLYRVEVQGTRVSLLVDGKPISRASTTQTKTLSNGPIHLLSSAAILRISSFRVLTI
ncbi:MAG TPA: family 16 glycoside hydrolase [Ktedonobacteraceae bacterium]|jgi:hypothetical protein|nr:family 16 glycoside hydrolase [Ktedonobacteraceae bacterium]